MFWVVYVQIYLQSVQAFANRDSDNPAQVKRVLDRFTEYVGLQTRQLHEITTLELETYIAKRRADTFRGQPIGEITLNNEITILNRAFYRAGPKELKGPGRRNFGYITEALQVPWMAKLPEFQTIVRTVKPEQMAQYIEASKFATTPHQDVCDPGLFWQSVLLLELVTRLRRKALLLVQRPSDEQLFERMEIFIPARVNSKRRKDQVISLGEGDMGRRVVEILGRLPSRPGEPFLPWKRRNGKAMSKAYFSNCVRVMQLKAGITDSDLFRIKDLRSTAGSKLAREFSDAVAKNALGHSQHTNTLYEHYYDPTPEEADRKASNRMASMAMPYLESEEPDPAPDVVRFPVKTG